MGDIELFKDIKGFEGLYKVSNLGNVKALEKFINHPKGGLRKLGERILKLHVEKGKYTSVSLFDNGFLKTYKLHQLVAMAFHGHTPNGFKGLIVDHINGDKTDNRAINLQLITQRENSSKPKDHYTSKYTGVHWNERHKKWYANIRIDGKKKYLGSFNNEYEAHLTYQSKLKEI